MQVHSKLAQRLHLPENVIHSNNALSFDKHINEELEKRLGQIEALLAKLAKDSKSRSGRVHMATVDDQSDPIFSDDDTSKPEDNDYNSDNSSAGSDSENRDMNIYISHGNGKKK